MQFLLKLHMVLDVVKPPLAVQVCAPAWRLCICVPGFTRFLSSSRELTITGSLGAVSGSPQP